MRPFRQPRSNACGQPPAARCHITDSRVDGWRFGELLTRTATSEVYRAIGSGGQRAVAKRLRAEVASQLPAMLDAEYLSLQRFADPAVVKVLDRSNEWLILEYLQYGDLRSLAGAPPNYWLPLVLAPLQWLAKMHAQGFVYGDLKLGHLMLRHPTQACCIDLATVAPVGVPMIARTPSLALPEQTTRATVAADVFAVGVMLYELLTAGLPSSSPSAAMLGPRQPLADLSSRCREAKPSDRPSLDDVLGQLRYQQARLSVAEPVVS